MEAWIPRRIINKKRLYANLRGNKWLDSDDFDAWSRGRAKQNLATVLAQGGERKLRHPFAPSYQFEAAIEPLAGLAIKGVIWYQGESNADVPNIAMNATKLKDVICSWRQFFGKPSLPFLMVQLPRINDPKRTFWPEFREAQRRAAAELAGVGLICTIDLGSTNANVHPPQKAPVAQRLAELALSMVYGEKSLPTNPRMTELKSSGNVLTLTFDQELKTTDGQAPRGFVVGNPSKPESFVEQEASLEGCRVIISRALKSGQVLRYINTTFAEPNLVGAEGGLPAFPVYNAAP